MTRHYFVLISILLSIHIGIQSHANNSDGNDGKKMGGQNPSDHVCPSKMVRQGKYWEILQYIGECPLNPQHRYIMTIRPQKSSRLKKTFQEYNLQGGGPTVIRIVEYIIEQERLFDLSDSINGASLDDEASVLRIKLIDRGQADLVEQKVISVLGNRKKLINTIHTLKSLGRLE